MEKHTQQTLPEQREREIPERSSGTTGTDTARQDTARQDKETTGPEIIRVKFVENGKVFTGHSKKEVVKKMFKAQWTSQTVREYMNAVGRRLLERDIVLTFTDEDSFFDQLLEHGVIEIK